MLQVVQYVRQAELHQGPLESAMVTPKPGKVRSHYCNGFFLPQVIQYAKHKCIKTANIVRDESIVKELKDTLGCATCTLTNCMGLQHCAR